LVTVKETVESVVKNFDPEQARGWDRVFQITITGEGGGAWNLVVKNQKCTLNKGEHKNPDIKVTTDANTWLMILSGKLSAPTAYMEGKLKADGLMDDLVRLVSIFPGLLSMP